MAQLLYIDLDNRLLSSSLGGNGFSFPALVAGQKYPLAFAFFDQVNGATVQEYPSISTLRIALGAITTAPASGTFCLQIGTGSSSSANTTGPLNFNASAATIAAALNALSACPSTITVRQGATSWYFSQASGAELTLQVVKNQLLPVSFGRVFSWELVGVWITEIALMQGPLAFCDTGEAVLPPSPFITVVRSGGVDSSGVFTWTEVQRLDMPATFNATFKLGLGYGQTALLSQADTADTIQTAINSMLSGVTYNGTPVTVTVTNPGDGYFLIEFLPAGYSCDALTVTVSDDAPPGNWTLTLSLDTLSVYSALQQQGTPLTGVPLEIEADFWIDPADHTQGTVTVKLVQMTVTLAAPVIWPDLSTVPEINWERPPSPLTYVPFSSSQVLTGQQQAYQETVGNGSSTSFTIDHNLNTPVQNVVVVANPLPGALLVPGTDYTVSITSLNSLVVTFLTAPSANQYSVFVVGIGPASVFQSGLTVTMDQVTGLVSLLSGYGSAITTLQGLLPSIPSAGLAASPNGITIPFSPVSAIIGYKGPAIPPSATGGLSESQLPLPKPIAGGDSFNVELWRLALNSSMFALGRTLAIDWGVALQLLRGNTSAEYQLVVELGTYAESGSPSHLNISWNTGTPVFSQPVVLTDEQVIHSFGISMTRGIVSSVDTIQLSQQLYGIATANNSAAPSNANFAIRCRLIDLQTENVTNPRGWVSYGLAPSGTAIDGATVAGAIISGN